MTHEKDIPHQEARGKELMRYHYAQHLTNLDRSLGKLENEIRMIRREVHRCSSYWTTRAKEDEVPKRKKQTIIGVETNGKK